MSSSGSPSASVAPAAEPLSSSPSHQPNCISQPARPPLRPRPQPGGNNALALYDDNGRITFAEARAHGIAPVPRGHPAYQYMRDGDNDGVVCE